MTLYMVATPIGNLEDITLRAVRILGEVDTVLAEDSRQTAKLLTHYKITSSVKTLHQHTMPGVLAKFVSEMVAGKNFALVTDAGTPGISDPGGDLVSAARAAGVEVVAVPGASAVTALLSVAGLPTDSFLFMGFLPKKKGRQTLWKELMPLSLPIIIFESPHRIVKTLEEVVGYLGDRYIVIGRELTKLHEEILSGSASELAALLAKRGEPKGEFVVLIAPEN